MLNSCIGVSDYNELYSLCQPLLPSPQSTLGLTRSTQRQPTPLQRAKSELPSLGIVCYILPCNNSAASARSA